MSDLSDYGLAALFFLLIALGQFIDGVISLFKKDYRAAKQSLSGLPLMLVILVVWNFALHWIVSKDERGVPRVTYLAIALAVLYVLLVVKWLIMRLHSVDPALVLILFAILSTVMVVSGAVVRERRHQSELKASRPAGP